MGVYISITFDAEEFPLFLRGAFDDIFFTNEFSSFNTDDLLFGADKQIIHIIHMLLCNHDEHEISTLW